MCLLVDVVVLFIEEEPSVFLVAMAVGGARLAAVLLLEELLDVVDFNNSVMIWLTRVA